MDSMVHPDLGLVCITASPAVRYSTITRTNLLRLDAADQRTRLEQLYTKNLAVLQQAIAYCQSHQIQLYRISSDIFPFADTALGLEILQTLASPLQQTGQQARDLGLRLVMHPDQFVVLSSDSPQVVENSVRVLQMHADILDLLGQPRSSWTIIEIHGGKGKRAEQLAERINQLPAAIRSRLALENDEHAYRAAEILPICQATGVPMVFDAHHHVVAEKLTSYEHPSIAEFVAAARTTWPVPDWQLAHISNGRASFTDRRHHDLIHTMPTAYGQIPWIEVEAKQKEVAIAKLQQEWQPVAGCKLQGAG